MGVIPENITNMKLGIFLIACLAAAVHAKKMESKNINIVCKELPTRKFPVEWPKQDKETILDFKKLEALKAQLEKKNKEIAKKTPKASILSLDDLKAKFSSKLVQKFKDFTQEDMNKRKTMKMFKKKKMMMMLHVVKQQTNTKN